MKAGPPPRRSGVLLKSLSCPSVTPWSTRTQVYSRTWFLFLKLKAAQKPAGVQKTPAPLPQRRKDNLIVFSSRLRFIIISKNNTGYHGNGVKSFLVTMATRKKNRHCFDFGSRWTSSRAAGRLPVRFWLGPVQRTSWLDVFKRYDRRSSQMKREEEPEPKLQFSVYLRD